LTPSHCIAGQRP